MATLKLSTLISNALTSTKQAYGNLHVADNLTTFKVESGHLIQELGIYMSGSSVTDTKPQPKHVEPWTIDTK